MRSFLFVFILLTLSKTAVSQIEGTWFFSRIENTDGLELKPTTPLDSMCINVDGSFSYSLDELGLKADGNWNLSDSLLTFYYNKPEDTVRTYRISLKQQVLTLKEGNALFIFKAGKPILLPTPIYKNPFSAIFKTVGGIALGLLLILGYRKLKKRS